MQNPMREQQEKDVVPPERRLQEQKDDHPEQKLDHLGWIRHLLQNLPAADPNYTDPDGVTPLLRLSLAAGRLPGDLVAETMSLLLEALADPNQKGGRSGLRPLHALARGCKRPEVRGLLNLLQENQADPWALDGAGRTPAEVARDAKNKDALDLLLRMEQEEVALLEEESGLLNYEDQMSLGRGYYYYPPSSEPKFSTSNWGDRLF